MLQKAVRKATCEKLSGAGRSLLNARYNAVQGASGRLGGHAPANEGKAPVDAAGGQQNLHGQASCPNGGAGRGGGGGGGGGGDGDDDGFISHSSSSPSTSSPPSSSSAPG